MSIDLNRCDGACKKCVIGYVRKHKQDAKDGFRIACNGIPLTYVPENVLAALGAEERTATAVVDPVTWAAEMLDWHCLDPDNSHWKRKDEEGSLGGFPAFDPKRPIGKSIFHRPYQAEMLRCTSEKKIFRIGRQSGKTECLCIMILYNIFNNENFNVEVIAPYQAQIDLIFKRLEELISVNVKFRNSIARNVKAPQYTLKLKNGSQVIGFTAGTRSKQDAGASRGQHANMLVFDEADMLSPADLDAALAVIINAPGATVWMSSTPTGRREKFYDNCHSPLYREFHYSSYVNPNWSPELEEYFREQLTEDGYIHEILAEFGEQEEGVYRFRYVEAAQADYEYGSFKPSTRWSYCIGVDWNDMKIGTTIAVVGFNPSEAMFYLVDHAVIARADRTQLVSCNKIAELNRIWHPDYIYVDRGYGSTQIEILHDFGARQLVAQGPAHPDARLRDIVKGYDFGGSVEVFDLFTKQPTKKPAKPFMVENSVRRFENFAFRYPRSNGKFTDQLLGYVVDRVSLTGRPVYEQRNERVGDHLLDAVNLALVAFTLEKSTLGKPQYLQNISFAPKFGEGEISSTSPVSETFEREAEKHKPKTDRAGPTGPNDKLFPSIHGDIPAANSELNAGIKLWSWPGFGHDAPRPTGRSLSEAVSQARQQMGMTRRNRRPERSKF